MNTLNDLRGEYELLFNTCVISSDQAKFGEIDGLAHKIIANQNRYKAIGDPLGIPWYFIGITHALETSLDFNQHLHNGDPLTARTVRVPAGRPSAGQPPFTFEESAKDALTLKKLQNWTSWDVAGMLFKFESFNGFGYRRNSIRINSPYLWSYSNHYAKGKFKSDGVYSPTLVSRQPGTAVILRRLAELQEISFGEQGLDRLKIIRELGETVHFLPNTFNDDAQRLQILLNEAGFPLRRDGKAGEKTSNAYQQVSGKFLHGDPRRV